MDNNIIIIKILRRRERQKCFSEEKSFDSTAIGDLAFLLLIFFIVTASFILRQGIFFSLPSQNAGSIKIEKKQIIEIYPQNKGFQYKGDILDRDTFKQVVIKRKKDDPNTVLIIFMAPTVKYDRLVDALSIARETGITRVSLKNKEREGKIR